MAVVMDVMISAMDFMVSVMDFMGSKAKGHGFHMDFVTGGDIFHGQGVDFSWLPIFSSDSNSCTKLWFCNYAGHSEYVTVGQSLYITRMAAQLSSDSHYCVQS